MCFSLFRIAISHGCVTPCLSEGGVGLIEFLPWETLRCVGRKCQQNIVEKEKANTDWATGWRACLFLLSLVIYVGEGREGTYDMWVNCRSTGCKFSFHWQLANVTAQIYTNILYK